MDENKHGNGSNNDPDVVINNHGAHGDEIDKIKVVNLNDQMKKAYINYSMSVIVARALPDTRDGLKPVHRRILYSMSELNLEPNKAYKKSARITGDVMGKYHPHGDSSIYDAMVRMAQPFSMRYPLVDGHGNFGSIDGDSAAAQRYTEARLGRLSVEMIRDIDKDTVDFKPNYTEEFMEPSVLPSKFPNLVVNGSSGIAVGMATNIPPHNLREAIDGCVLIIDNYVNENRETEPQEMLPVIKGPDFPTGASILGTSGIKQAYLTGRGKITVRSICDIQPLGLNREQIIVTEIPYQVNKARMVERIADLVKEKRVEGIADMRDESNRLGIRIVIELKKDANASVVLNTLYKYTQLQETFGIINLALVDGEPKILNMKEMLAEYIRHQKNVVTRRSQFELNKAQKREHIVSGFIKALDFIDEIISIIRSNREIARSKEIIMEKFGFTQEQADAIVEMRLRSLSGLEREKLEKELGELRATIARLMQILGDEKELYGVIRGELLEIKERYGDERRTSIVPYEGDIDIEDLIDDETMVITMTGLDYVKRQDIGAYRLQNRGGRGIMGMGTRDEDMIKDIFLAKTHDDLLFITNQGKAFRMKAYQVPEANRQARGTAIVNLMNVSGGERVAAVLALRDYKEGYLMMVTKKGVVKKTPLSAFANIRQNGLIALNFKDEDDELISVLHTSGSDDIILATSNGMGIRFTENDVREMGRTAAGVRGINLDEGDVVVGAALVTEGQKLLFATENGYGKCTEYQEFRKQLRGGRGLKAYGLSAKTGQLIGIASVNEREELMMINSDGVIIRIPVSGISTYSRYASGVKLINLDNEEVKLVSLAKIGEDYIEEHAEDEGDDAEAAGDVDDTDEAVTDEAVTNDIDE